MKKFNFVKAWLIISWILIFIMSASDIYERNTKKHKAEEVKASSVHG